MSKRLIDHDPELVLWALIEIMHQVVLRTEHSFRLNDIPYGDSFSSRSLGMLLKEVIELLNQFWWDVQIIRSKRRKNAKVSSSNYTWTNLAYLLGVNFSDYDSLSVYDFIIKDWEIVLSKIEILQQKMVDDFVNWKTINGVDYNKSKKMLYKRLLAHVELYQDEYKSTHVFVWRQNFPAVEKFPFIHICSVFYDLGYIEISPFGKSIVSLEVGKNGFWGYGINIVIKDSLIEILKRHLVLEDIILETILDDKYKELKLVQKNNSMLLERLFHETADGTKFVELQKAYPYSEIKAKNHDGKIMKYEVREKIKLDQSGKE